jgi:hypothetical protein
LFILEVYDINFHRLGIINDYSYAQYINNAYSVGSFNLKCDASAENIDLIKKDRILWLEGNVAGLIQYIYKESEESTTVEVKGNLIGIILNWRYIYPVISLSDKPINKVMEKYVSESCINNSDSKRNFSFLELAESDFELEKISKDVTGDTVEEALEDVISTDGFDKMASFFVGFYPRKKKFIFEIKRGKDRTKGNIEGNKTVLFSQDLKNIIKSEYTLNTEDFRNIALVAGESPDGDDAETNRKTLIVLSDEDSEEPSGFDRRELYVDARDLQSESTDDEGNTTTISDSEYNAKLKTRGLEKLGDCLEVESYEGEIRNDSETVFHYNQDYFLGDKVDIIDTDLKLRIQAIVTGVTITQENGEYTVNPSFGFTQPTLYEKLKKKGVI